MSPASRPRQAAQFLRYYSLIVLVLSFTGGVARGGSGNPNLAAQSTVATVADRTISLFPIGNNHLGGRDPGVSISGSEMTMLSGGRPVFFEVRVGNWDPDGEGRRLAAWQVTFDPSSYTSGSNGALTAYVGKGCAGTGDDVPCIADLGPGASCDPPGYFYPPGTCSFAFIDTDHENFVYEFANTPIITTDVSSPVVRWAGTIIVAGPDVPQPFPAGGMYAGTLALWVPSDATGSFTISLEPHPLTQLLDQDQQFILPLQVFPALMTIPDCDEDGFSDADEINGCPAKTPGCADCNENGIPDECDIEDGVSTDCNTNGVPDECELENCAGSHDCDDCNMNDQLDECDIAGTSTDDDGDGIPDGECSTAEAACTVYSECFPELQDVNPSAPYPDNLFGVFGRWVTIDGSGSFRTASAGASGILLDVTVEVEGLRLINGGTLLLTQQGAGDLSTAAVGIINEGNLLICNDRQIDLNGGTMLIGPGGTYGLATGPNASACSNEVVSASLVAGDVVITEGDCQTLRDGGDLGLDQAMTAQLTGDLTVVGPESLACAAGGVASRLGINPAPKFRVTGPGGITLAGNFKMSGFASTGNSVLAGLASAGRADVSGQLIGGMILGGDFVNHAIAPSLFDWVTGRLTMNGSGPEPQVFEVAGLEVARSLEGFFTERDTLFDTTSHTNYSIGKFEVAAGSHVTFVNDFANTAGAGPCAEALYVKRLILGAGSTITLDDARVYYEILEGDESGVQVSGCGGLINLCDANAPTTSVAVRNRYLSFAAGAPGRIQAVRVRFADLPPAFVGWKDSELWVGEPREVSHAASSVPPLSGFENFYASMLQCDPFYTDWSQFGTVDVFHEGIIPEGVYHLQVVEEVCSASVEGNFSAVLEVIGPKWGDTISDFTDDPPGAPNGILDIIDALAVVDRFGNKPGSIVKTRADVEPACVDLVINITDVMQTLTGFQGLAYPNEPTAPDPCNSNCQDPLR